ncbi:homoserine dehydrogenase [Lacrimispora sp. 210928-DFI.3.58]|uniref:homoserine dehydrogenase n=1 Tax=Lacrimispora sp. 210928-DFI.3.58 TaxID=2883214 RepID=UPI0015B4A60D|nr:homoserine dehydrogenase [Lacrimispora sp. 210928-DFI.3.58]MCB7320003.1 homoserine dehydrogenase [Lacrimispora sp. 210928-DFI.3.58]
MIKTAVMGYGTIGSGVVEILEQNKDVIAKRAGQEVELKYVLDLREFPDSPVADKIIHDFKTIETDEEVKIVVEAMGGLNPAYPFVKACLLGGKHVVTSNKALVAAYGTELLEIAREKKVNFFFEASVGGGIPIIRPLYRCLMGERIEEISGILNGTTNYILTKMDKEGESFENALKEAQNLGYAERNPEADVEGHDTCRKIAILTAMATGKEVNYEDIYTEGITKITDIDFKYAEKMGASVKLLGTSRMKDGRVNAYVAPVMLDKTNPLYAVNDVFNGIMVKGNMLGTSMFYGSGAGKLPTASAVVADIIEAAQNLEDHVEIGWTEEKQAIEPMDQASFRYFVRIAGSYRNKEQDVKSLFGKVEVYELYGMDEFAILTQEMKEGEFKAAAIAFDTKEQAQSDFGIKQMIRAML